MAGLRHAQWRNTLDDVLSYDGTTTYQDDGGDVRPRIGTGGVRRQPVRRKARLERTLAIGVAVLMVGSGTLLGLHFFAGQSRPALAEQGSNGRTPPTIDTRDQAVKVASLLGTKGMTGAAPSQAGSAPAPAAAASAPAAPVAMAAAAFVPATPKTGTGAPVPDAPPTKADFERPAFLEPRDGEDQSADEAPVVTAFAAEAAPAIEAPLPAPRPAARPRVASTEEAADKADPAEGGRSTKLIKSINLRSAPKKGASTIGVLSAGTKVTLYSCKSWCEVSTGDKRGYVYKDAISQ